MAHSAKPLASFAASIVLVAAAAAADFPTWAYPIAPPSAPGDESAPDDGKPRHVPDSSVALTLQQFAAHVTAVPDWHPDGHPAMPEIVNRGREPKVWACAYCHLPNGAGRPENASLAGLPPTYFKQQVAAFKNGDRPGSASDRAPQNFMIALAKNVTAAELDEAATYFSSLKPGGFVKVVETDNVPKTFVAGAMLAKVPNASMEPIGDRIIEVPEDLGRADNRDSRTPYVAYVPPGSLKKGAALVLSGDTGKTLQCSACHGPELKGLGDIPRLAGRSPSYLLRQLYDFKAGTRRGGLSALMTPVVAKLSQNDMVAISAYLASREP